MEEVLSAMVIEESKLRMMSGNNPMKLAYTIVAERLCYNCGKKGHMSYNCLPPKNYGDKSGTRGGHGGAVVIKEAKVVVVVDVREDMAEVVVPLKPMQPWRVLS